MRLSNATSHKIENKPPSVALDLLRAGMDLTVVMSIIDLKDLTSTNMEELA